MKNLTLPFLILGMLLFFGCQQENNVDKAKAAPDYATFDKHVETIRAFFKAHCDEDLELCGTMLADTLKWSPPYYNGNTWLGKSDYLAGLKNYQDGFENVSYDEGILIDDTTGSGFWSGSVYPKDQAAPDPNNVRIYGTWKGTYSETGNDVALKYYAIAFFDADGKISRMTEYFDVGGLMAEAMGE